MSISQNIKQLMANSYWIRKMFEEGERLKAIHGEENVLDFSLGNPNVPPPEKFDVALFNTVKKKEIGSHGYMPNAGYQFVRKTIADHISIERDIEIKSDQIIMTSSASGALNVAFKTILNPRDEVLVFAPYFPEYAFYADNHGGVLKTIPTTPDFKFDIETISSALTKRTRIVLINSPNNPTGQIYSEQSILELSRLLKEKSEIIGRTIYLISDEPYYKLVYDEIRVPDIFKAYAESIIVTSFSKMLSIPGERIGYIAINPMAAEKKLLSEGMAFCNRILGFVNAPALMQRVVASLQGATVDVSLYKKKRNMICKGLREAGYELIKPSGAFYVFPKSPIIDDVSFVASLKDEMILTVPGSGYGCPGHFRIAYCVEDEIIEKAIPAFKKVMNNYK